MPELPDVETFRRYLDANGLDRTIARTHVEAEDLLEGLTAQGLGQRLKGRRLTATRRHGKYLFAARDDYDGWLVLHFGMSGFLQAVGPGESPPQHTRMTLDFEDGGVLAYAALRKLGLIAWTDDPAAFAAARGLGPDALAIERAAFVQAVRCHRGGVKCWLMDQSALAGVGNVYSDEVLFQAGLHPKRKGNRLGEAEADRLYDALHAVLEAAVDARADPDRLPEGHILPLRGKEAPCPRCGGPLSPIKACGRTGWYCPACQPAG
ncbi:MAG TPA: DNA-formamidopyrimidine glycosylase family protein [Gammaproteobacteria bacterium]|nr:DNA-formamidopyrimidine glycosylase family protein [Gammaproteobacteria bacterium]